MIDSTQYAMQTLWRNAHASAWRFSHTVCWHQHAHIALSASCQIFSSFVVGRHWLGKQNSLCHLQNPVVDYQLCHTHWLQCLLSVQLSRYVGDEISCDYSNQKAKWSKLSGSCASKTQELQHSVYTFLYVYFCMLASTQHHAVNVENIIT